MHISAYLALGAVFSASLAARDVRDVNPPFPRIGNCYGAGLGWTAWDEGAEYWSKLDLIIGGGYDLHYDWEHERWARVMPRLEANLRRLRQINPHVLVLPYVDVIEGPDNPNVPAEWWDLRDGQRWSGWPGYFRINTRLPEVLAYNLERVREDILSRDVFDGVFYDCWSPDDWLVPRTAQLRDGQAVVMVNCWNLPTTGFEHLNGALAEDEVNRVMAGKVDFEDFLARYLRWCRESRKPVVTMLVCCPTGLDGDVWGFQRLSREERAQRIEEARAADQQTMRFGLATTLMGDGYFGYDAANMGRGRWWWYPEYDAPLGYPKGDARRAADGTWWREFDGGTVVTNGTPYDAVVELPSRHRDVSTGRVATRFTLPSLDGRIYLPTDEPATATPDLPSRLAATPPERIEAVALPHDRTAVRTPGGLDLRFDPAGALQQVLFAGRPVLSGGWPVVAAPPFRHFAVESTGRGEPERQADGSLRLTYDARLTDGEQQATLRETVAVGPGDRFTLRFEATALTALTIRLWRHYFAFPVSRYAGAIARAGEVQVELPAELGEERLLPSATHVSVSTAERIVTIESTLPLGLIDHRKYGPPEYLLAGYPVGGDVAAGRTWTVELTVGIASP